MADLKKINDLDYQFDNLTIPLKTSLAWDGKARANGEVHNMIINVRMSGVQLLSLVRDALAQGAVKFQRTRRAKDSGGVFETREGFDKYLKQLGNETDLHFSQLGHSPTDPNKAAETLEASLASMSPAEQEAWLKEKMKSLKK